MEGGVILGEAAASPPHQPNVWGRCKLPQRGPVRSPGHQSIFLHFMDAGWLFLSFQILLGMPQPLTTSEYVNNHPELW